MSRSNMIMRYALLFVCSIVSSVWASPKVVVSISPLAAITTTLMEGIGSPYLLQKSNSDPHHATLKPSEINLLQTADLVVWIGPGMEHAFAKTISQLDAHKVMTLETLPMLKTLPFTSTHFHTHASASSAIDPHIWLDPDNAMLIAQAITKKLITLDPEHKTHYLGQLEKIQRALKQITKTLKASLSPLKTKRFFSFHDDLRYFYARFGLDKTGGITENTETSLSLNRIKEVRAALIESNTRCILIEPGTTETQLNALTAQLNITPVVVSTLPDAPEEGIDNYIKMLKQIAATLHTCHTMQ